MNRTAPHPQTSGQRQPSEDAAAKPVDELITLVEGQITTASGQGLRDALITVYRAEEYPEGKPIATTRTDSLGDFTVRHTGKLSGKLKVKVSMTRYAEHVETIEVAPGQPAPFVGTTLRGALSLSGRVVDASTKEPIGGATVRFQSVGSDRFVTANDEGRFTIDTLTPGEGRLLVSGTGYGREIERIDSVEEAGEVTVALKPERRVTITIVNDRNEPVFGAAIEAVDREHDDFRSVITEEDGRAEIVGLNFDTQRLELRLWHSDHVSSILFDRRLILPQDRPHSQHTMVMERGGRLMGRVLDGRMHTELQGARVMVGAEYDDSNPVTWTDDRGRYLLEGLPPGPAIVTVHVRRFSPQLKEVEIRPGQTIKIDFAMRSPARVTGVVKGADGKPIEGAEVISRRWLGEMTLGIRAMTDEQGRFVFNESPLEEYDIAVIAPGHHILTQTIQPLSGPFEFILQPLEDTSSGPGRMNPGDKAPVVTMTTLRDERLNLAELRNKVIVIDFWATWCPPCIDEMRYLSRIYDKFRLRDDFVLISVSRDFDEGELRRFLKERGPYARWHHVYGAERGAEDAIKAFGVSAVPRMFIIGRDGRLIDRDLRGERLVARMDEVMGESDQNR